MRINLLIATITLSLANIATTVLGNGVVSVDFVPPGLSPGDTYQIGFVTDGTTDATSINVQEYNNFVTQQAELASSTTETWGVEWFAFTSTPTVNARDNALVSAPVYFLNGIQAFTGFDDVWDGSSYDTSAATDQFSVTLPGGFSYWFGSNDDGTSALGYPFDPLSDPPYVNNQTLGQASPAFLTDIDGDIYNSFADFDGTANSSFGQGSNTDQRRLAVISEVLTVVPEPTAALFLCGSGALIGLRRRRR